METSEKKNWYATRILRSKSLVQKYISLKGYETFVPTLEGKPVFASLVFVKCTLSEIVALKYEWYDKMSLYRDAGLVNPEPIPDRELENFRLVLSIRDAGVVPVVVRDPQFLVGDKVRVKDGIFKGAEGVVRRIKGSRRVVVAITGVAAVATSYVAPELLEPIENQ